MVDPNRKINHLTDDDVNFLQECENEFKDRFTDTDEEFLKHCNSLIDPTTGGCINTPPIVYPWNGRRPQQGNYRGGGFNHRNNNYRGHRGRGGGGGNYNNRNNSYGGAGNYNRNNQRYGSNYSWSDGRGGGNDGHQSFNNKRPHDNEY